MDILMNPSYEKYGKDSIHFVFSQFTAFEKDKQIRHKNGKTCITWNRLALTLVYGTIRNMVYIVRCTAHSQYFVQCTFCIKSIDNMIALTISNNIQYSSLFKFAKAAPISVCIDIITAYRSIAHYSSTKTISTWPQIISDIVEAKLMRVAISIESAVHSPESRAYILIYVSDIECERDR